MAIIKSGDVYQGKFMGNNECRVDVVLGALPVIYSVLAPYRTIEQDSKYQLNLKLDKKQYEEVKAEVAGALKRLAEEAEDFSATSKQIDDAISRAIRESKKEPGTFQFFGSRKMGFVSRETGDMTAITLNCYDKEVNEDSLIEGGARLGAGSVVKSKFTLSLWKNSQKQVCLNINPVEVVVLEKVEPPKRSTLGYDGVSSDYDY